MSPKPEIVVDAVGLICPIPIIQLARGAKDLGHGILELVADDPATQSDVSAWCSMRSATLLETATEQRDGSQVFRYLIQVGADSPENAGGVASTSERLIR